MTKTLRDETFVALDHLSPQTFSIFGEKAQMIKAIEELAELSQVLAKRLNNSPVTDTNIIDEIADVLVITNQLRWKFGADEVDKRMFFKLERTQKFMAAMKKELTQTVTLGHSDSGLL